MYRLIFLMFIISLSACDNNVEEQKPTSEENSGRLKPDTINKEIKLTTRFNSFDTTAEVLFWDTKDSISSIQRKNYEGFISKQDLLTPEILQKIFEFYKDSYKDYRAGWKAGGNMEDKDLEKFLPNPTTPKNLKSFITPATIHIQNTKYCKEGTLGIEFDCSWDIENGLGVKIENWKVVEAGVAETSYFFD